MCEVVSAVGLAVDADDDVLAAAVGGYRGGADRGRRWRDAVGCVPVGGDGDGVLVMEEVVWWREV